MLHKACALCGQPPVAAVNLGPLLGPIREVRDRGTEELWVHRLCALWSSEVRGHAAGGMCCAVPPASGSMQLRSGCIAICLGSAAGVPIRRSCAALHILLHHFVCNAAMNALCVTPALLPPDLHWHRCMRQRMASCAACWLPSSGGAK